MPAIPTPTPTSAVSIVMPAATSEPKVSDQHDQRHGDADRLGRADLGLGLQRLAAGSDLPAGGDVVAEPLVGRPLVLGQQVGGLLELHRHQRVRRPG